MGLRRVVFLLVLLCLETCEGRDNKSYQLVRPQLVHDQKRTAKRTRKSPYYCSKCRRRMKSKDQLRIHLASCSKKEFHCIECNKPFKWRTNLNRHVHDHHSQKVRAIGKTCPKCDRVFQDMSNLKRHMEVHDNITEYKCPACSYKARRRSNLQRHIQSMHSGKNTTKRAPRGKASGSFRRCPDCSFTTNRNYNFLRHLESQAHLKNTPSGKATKKNRKNEKIKCHICSSMMIKRNIKEHLRTKKCISVREKQEQETIRIAAAARFNRSDFLD